MKKVLLSLFIVFLVIFTTGCKKDKEEEEVVKANYSYYFDNAGAELTPETLEIFNNATKDYTESNLNMVSLLATQIVAGTNYLFLCNTGDSYKFVVIYNDLQNNSSVTNVYDFDYNKYLDKNTSNTNENLTGGWSIYNGNINTLNDNNAQTIFSSVTSSDKERTFNPLALIAKDDSVKKYVVLATETKNNNANLTVLTLSEKRFTSSNVNLIEILK